MQSSEVLAAQIKEAPLRLLAARIKRARRDAKLTLDDLAALVGTSRQHLIRLEKAEHRPRPDMLIRIAAATKHRPEWFCDPSDALTLNGRSDLVADLMVEIGTKLMEMGTAERARLDSEVPA